MTRYEELKWAKEMYYGWLKAEQAIMTGQEYTIGSRTLRRADLRAVRDSVKHWKNEVTRLESSSRNGIRIQRVVPRDI